MHIKPHPKLLTKQWLTLLVMSVIIVIAGALTIWLIPLAEKVPPEMLGGVVWPLVAIAVLAMWVVSAPIVALWIRNLSYHIEEDRIIIHKGILTKVQQNIPYRAITDFQLHRSLFDRFLGIGAIRIQTAGQSQTGTGYEGQLAGLIDWDALHEQLRDKVKKLHPTTEALAVAEPVRQPLPADKLGAILDELRAIRRALENRSS